MVGSVDRPELPLWVWALPLGPHTTGLGELLGLAGRGGDLGFTVGIGLVAAIALPWVMHGQDATQAGLGRALLSHPTRPGELDLVQAPSSSSS